MNDYLSIGETAKALGVSVPTLRRWDRDGKFSPNYRTNGHHRRYSKNSVFSLLGKQRNKKVVGYARVSSHDQKDDLQRQIDVLSNVSDEVISDLGSGINFKKKGL
jgi:excisionase family DNA binding protein